jgi:phage N-6-adenine-methyltransferase
MANDEWGTPPELYRRLDEVFLFTLDPAASNANHVAPTWYTKEQNGLAQPWPGRCFCNPPYSDPTPWILRASLATLTGESELVVMLLPVDTSTEWFRTIWDTAAELLLLHRRLSYTTTGKAGLMPTSPARFASFLALFTLQPFRGLQPLADLGIHIPLYLVRALETGRANLQPSKGGKNALP